MSEFLYSLLTTSWTSTKQLKTDTKSKLTNKKSDCLNIADDFFSPAERDKAASLKSICIVNVFRVNYSNFFFFFKWCLQEIQKSHLAS